MRQKFLAALGLLGLILFFTYSWWRPTTLSTVLEETQIKRLPAGATQVVVSGGHVGFGTDYRVTFLAQPDDVAKWLAELHATRSQDGTYHLKPGDGEGPIGKSIVRVGPGAQVQIIYHAHL